MKISYCIARFLGDRVVALHCGVPDTAFLLHTAAREIPPQNTTKTRKGGTSAFVVGVITAGGQGSDMDRWVV